MTVNCNMCKGMCCFNPPALHSKEEIDFALEKGCTLLCIKTNKGYNISIKAKEEQCPFLYNGNCSIYKDRFLACKEFNCKALDKNIDEVDVNDFITLDSTNQSMSITYFTEEFINNIKQSYKDRIEIYDSVFKAIDNFTISTFKLALGIKNTRELYK